MNATIDIFLPKVIITNLDTVQSMKQKIANTIANMGIGTIELFDLNFSKKHMNHYGFITVLLSDTNAARRFVRCMEDRGFAKLTDKDYYWRVCRYIAPEKRRVLDTAFIQEDDDEDDVKDEVKEEEEAAPDWEEPNDDEPFDFTLTQRLSSDDASRWADALDLSTLGSADALDLSTLGSADALDLSTLGSADAFDTSLYDSQILELLSDDDEFQSTFVPSLEMSEVDVPSCDYTIYTNWNHHINSLQSINSSHHIVASRIFPNITVLSLCLDDNDYIPQQNRMDIPNLLIGVNNCDYDTLSSQKRMDWM
jgi:hypothetical protein